jgi:anaerobic ribonucleoside-triphosphate reductase activating protein
LKVGWYSGMDELSDKINLDWFDYVKIGHYDEDLGPLNKETTNQRFFRVTKSENDYQLMDLTNLFWKKVTK